MKENKHIEKELLFKNNIKDITSISLDSDYNIDNDIIKGNFIISGDYKIHEISINRENFNFKIPFEYELDKDIDVSTINVEITNFEYDYNKDELKVNIDYNISGDKIDIYEFESKESLDDFLKENEVDIIDERISDIKEDILDEDREIEISKSKDEVVEKKEENLDKETTDERVEDEKVEDEKVYIDTKDLINDNDEFVTYKVHKLKENENIESIVMKYHIDIDELKEYNDLNNLNIGDKIIIPKYE